MFKFKFNPGLKIISQYLILSRAENLLGYDLRRPRCNVPGVARLGYGLAFGPKEVAGQVELVDNNVVVLLRFRVKHSRVVKFVLCK